MRRLKAVARAEAALEPPAKSALRSVGVALRIARARRGESREHFGARILVSRATLQRLEAGDAFLVCRS
jgi:ribosome-binding protein aMBF1 (putative translation factor)